MKVCDLDPVKLAAYLDGELSERDAALVHQHIASCSPCAAEVAEVVALKRSLRMARAAHAPSAAFRAQIRAQIAPQKKAWRSRLMWPVAQATIAAMLLISMMWMARPRRGEGLQEAVDLHLNALASANPLDVVSTDRHTVKPWFQGRIPFSFNLPEFGGTPFTLQGGRMTYLQRQPGAQLFVGIGQHRVSVLVFQESQPTDLALPTTNGIASRNAFNVESWHTASLRFVIVGDADPSAMARLGQMLQQANP